MKVNELLTPFLTALHVTSYDYNLDEEFKHVKNLEYLSNGHNGNYKSKDIYVLEHKNMEKIKEFIQRSLDYYTTKFLESTQQVKPTISWTNKNPKGSRHHEHIHPNSILSGVFYFAIDDSAPIRFHNSKEWGLKLNYTKYNDFNSEVLMVPMKAGELIVFPSSSKHSVPVNRSDNVRYSLSFNTFIKDKIIGDINALTYLNVEE